jgi:hypothetical protein
VYQFSLPYTLTYSKLFGGSKKLVVAMKEKMVICGLHILGDHYLSPEIPLVSLKQGYLTGLDRD